MYTNNDYRNYLSHHGILGMHWGVRRFQPYSTTGPRKGGKTGKEIGEAKKVAKNYEREINKLQGQGRGLTTDFVNYADQREASKKLSSYYELKANTTKSDRKRMKYLSKAKEWTNTSDVYNKKVNELAKLISENHKQSTALLSKMKNDPLVSYRTVYSSKGSSRATTKMLNDKYGKTKLAKSTYADYASGTDYKVRAKNSFAGRSKKYTDDRYKNNHGITLHKMQYYYY